MLRLPHSKTHRLKVILPFACFILALVLVLGIRLFGNEPEPEMAPEPEPEVPTMFGIKNYLDYTVRDGVLESGQNVTNMLSGTGVGLETVDRLVKSSLPVFDTRQLRAGNPYHLYFSKDSLESSLRHMVYEKNAREYVLYTFLEDSVSVTSGMKDIVSRRRKVGASISTSLWNSIVGHDLPLTLSGDLEDVFGWTVDFFALQKEDSFTVIFDEEYVDSVRIGVGRIWGAYFRHQGKDIYAIPYAQDSVKVSYWDKDGASLRKQLLKAPLKYSRISSRFSSGRLHPILKTVRAHYGVDYAAPSGTPVVAIADGTVTQMGWTSGGGNTLYLRHANSLSSSYMHLRGYAKGLKTGSRVAQGDVIGYVGSTGLSTGPHLDFRLYKGNTPIDPLKAPTEPVEPIRDEHSEAFMKVRDRVLMELTNDSVPDSVRIRLDDLYPLGAPLMGDSLQSLAPVTED